MINALAWGFQNALLRAGDKMMDQFYGICLWAKLTERMLLLMEPKIFLHSREELAVNAEGMAIGMVHGGMWLTEALDVTYATPVSWAVGVATYRGRT